MSTPPTIPRFIKAAAAGALAGGFFVSPFGEWLFVATAHGIPGLIAMALFLGALFFVYLMALGLPAFLLLRRQHWPQGWMAIPPAAVVAVLSVRSYTLTPYLPKISILVLAAILATTVLLYILGYPLFRRPHHAT